MKNKRGHKPRRFGRHRNTGFFRPFMRTVSRLTAAGPLILAGLLFYHSRDLAWGGAEDSDGTRYKVSPLGVVHVLEPNQTVSRTVICRWVEPDAGGPCAAVPNAPFAWRLLQLVNPLLWLGALIALAGALAMSQPAWSTAARACAATAIAIALAAPGLLAFSVPRASQRIQPLEFGVGGTLGTLELAVTAALLGGLIIGLQSRRPSTVAARVACGGALLAPLLLFGFLFPMPAALGFFVPGAGLGMLSGSWASVRHDRARVVS
jgi:hypothetical protein